MPRSTVVDVFRLLDGTFEPAVGEGVAFIELQVSFVREVAVTSFREDVLDVVVGDNTGGEFDEVFAARLQVDAILHHHWELLRLTDEDVE